MCACACVGIESYDLWCLGGRRFVRETPHGVRTIL